MFLSFVCFGKIIGAIPSAPTKLFCVGKMQIENPAMMVALTMGRTITVNTATPANGRAASERGSSGTTADHLFHISAVENVWLELKFSNSAKASSAPSLENQVHNISIDKVLLCLWKVANANLTNKT